MIGRFRLPVNASVGVERLSLCPEFVGNNVADLLDIRQALLEGINSCSLCRQQNY